ncbi:MAG: DUF1223 domain-containing protein, partial [Terracidiphilus sp.]
MQRQTDWVRRAGVAALAAACFAVAATGQSATEQRKPVLVELFTSEGCSDCPPADRLLQELDEKQPFAGVEAIVLSEHVTYWNHDGWTDPFSLDEMTERQQEYVNQFRLNSSYTPEMVVDGTTQFVGNDVRAVTAALEKAATQPKEDVTIANAQWGDGGATFAVHASADHNARLVAVLAANATQRSVSAGENKGKTLEHVAVVRVMKTFGAESLDGRPLRLG